MNSESSLTLYLFGCICGAIVMWLWIKFISKNIKKEEELQKLQEVQNGNIGNN